MSSSSGSGSGTQECDNCCSHVGAAEVARPASHSRQSAEPSQFDRLRPRRQRSVRCAGQWEVKVEERPVGGRGKAVEGRVKVTKASG